MQFHDHDYALVAQARRTSQRQARQRDHLREASRARARRSQRRAIRRLVGRSMIEIEGRLASEPVHDPPRGVRSR